MNERRYPEKLLWSGMILFLLGLVAGVASPAFRNPRLGLSAHLEGVMNGMFLILIGLLWDRVRLTPARARIVFVLLLWAGYVNWLACVLGGAFGASRMTPIAGGGFSAEYEGGMKNFKRLYEADNNHPVETTGRKLRKMMPWLKAKEPPKQA
jgi:hypothetical protein